MYRFVLAVVLINLAGCCLYFGDNDDDCYNFGAAKTNALYFELRDPTTRSRSRRSSGRASISSRPSR